MKRIRRRGELNKVFTPGGEGGIHTTEMFAS